MDRRRFLRNLLSTAAIAATAPHWLGQSAWAGDPAVFAAGLARDPMLGGWRSVGAESLGPASATIEGRLPAGLRGVLYRNGPAWFERNGFRYDHWFDGDGMVHAWSIGDGKVVHRAKMVETPKFARERREGRFVVPAAGSSVPDRLPIRNNDDASTANTSVVVIDGKLFALQEGGSAFEIERAQLDTIGAKTWRPDLAALPFSAHPLVDRDGSLWNFGSINLMGGTGLLVWHIGSDGRLISATTLDTPIQGYLHAFAMTDDELVFVLTPFEMSDRGAFFERLRFQPQQPVRIGVVAKSEPDKARWFEADFGMVYHFADAHRHGNVISVRAVRHDDVDAAKSPMKAAMAGHGIDQAGGERLVELRIDLGRGVAGWHDLGQQSLEFPVFDARSRGHRSSMLYAPMTSPGGRLFDSVMAFDGRRERRRVHRYGAGMIAEEHLFVPRAIDARIDDGWLIGPIHDSRRGRCGLAILDSRHVEDGPVATAWLDYGFPLGFHGTFASA